MSCRPVLAAAAALAMTLAVTLTMALELTACATAGSPPEATQPAECLAPRGSPDQLTTPAGVVLDDTQAQGFRVTAAPVEMCAGTSGVVTLTGSGARRFVLPPDEPTCAGRPAPDDPCDTVHPDAFGYEVFERLKAEGVTVIGIGMGACGKVGAWDAWRFGVSVADWAEADRAIAVVAEHLRAWDVGHTYAVSVRPIRCGVLLEN